MYLRLSKLSLALSAVGCLVAAILASRRDDNLAAYCHDDKSGQTILSGALDQKCDGSGADLHCEDRGKYIAYYNSTSHNGGSRQLIGYKESNVSMRENNREVRALCHRIARGGKINLPAPRP